MKKEVNQLLRREGQAARRPLELEQEENRKPGQ